MSNRGSDDLNVLDVGLPKRKAPRSTISSEHGSIRLHCPNCGMSDFIHGTLNTRTFMVRFNRFRRTHDRRCAVHADVDILRTALNAEVSAQLLKAAKC